MNFKDIKFSNYVDPDEMAKVEKWLEENKPLFWRYTSGQIVPPPIVANYCIGIDGDKPISLLNQICHNSMDSFPETNGNRNCIGTSIALNNNKFGATKEEMLPFFDYFCNRSFAAPMIAKVTEDWVIFSADNPSLLFQNALILSRHFREVSGWSFRLFNEYTSKGCPEEFCYHYFFHSYLSACTENKGIPMVNKGAHRAFNFPCSVKVMKNLLHREYGKFDMTHYREKALKFGGVNLGGNSLAWEFFNELTAEEGEVSIPNPFARKVTTAVTVEQALDLIPEIKKKGILDGCYA